MTDPNTADNTATPQNEPAASQEGAESQPMEEAEVSEAPAQAEPTAETETAAEAPAQAEPTAETQAAADTAEAPAQAEPTTETETAAEAPAQAEPTTEAEAAPEAAPVPRPGAPKPGAIPTPAALAHAAPRASAAAPPIITTDHSASAAFGRVDDNGAVFVRTAEGEREVGSYPGASNEQALTYFARKYDELFASAVLLEQRVEQPEVPSKDVQDALKKLKAQVKDAAVVGDLAALDAKLTHIETLLAAKRETEQVARLKAREEAKAERERIVGEAEEIAGQPENRIQWKTSGARMRELLDEWKQHQRSSTRLDRETETALWQRFSAARNRFDKSRRAHFASLDASHADAKSAKEHLVAEAEALSTSTDWAATAGAFKRLMDQWRNAGRASRADDDRLWARFKAAQDAFFAAKDQVVAAEEEEFRGNLVVKEELLAEAQSILPVTDLEKAKAQLRAIQEKWEAAGKVPRSDMDRVEKGLRRIEQTVRDAEDHKWKATNPEVAARAQGMVEQLERAVADLEADLAKAEASGNAAKIAKARDALEARRAWLEQARAGVQEFGG
ncbi:MAG TPA: DUF349 domain-containing protein [Dermatophilaceae bacterium]|nr:DUF349 domain-containing protein [Dermatophilaceae bacterium]